MKNTARVNASNCPHVKWGSLLIAVITISIAIVFFTINLYGNIANSDIIVSALAIIGWVPALLLAFSGILIIFAEFIPSFNRYKVYKSKKEYVKAVKLAIRNSDRLSYNIKAKEYKDFRLENPKYL